MPRKYIYIYICAPDRQEMERTLNSFSDEKVKPEKKMLNQATQGLGLMVEPLGTYTQSHT